MRPRPCDRQRHRLLRGVRMLVARVNFQFPVHLLAEFGLRQHARNRFFDHPGRTGGANLLRARFDQTARITGEMPVNLLRVFAARQLHLGGIDHDHVIARIEKRRINRLMLAHQNRAAWLASLPRTTSLASITCQFLSIPGLDGNTVLMNTRLRMIANSSNQLIAMGGRCQTARARAPVCSVACLSTFSQQMGNEFVSLQTRTVPTWTDSGTNSIRLASCASAVVQGLGSGFPSSRRISARSSIALAIMDRASARLNPWETAPGKIKSFRDNPFASLAGKIKGDVIAKHTSLMVIEVKQKITRARLFAD